MIHLPIDPRLAAMLRKAQKPAASKTARTKPLGPTPERSRKPDMIPGIIARYAKRGEIAKHHETAANRLRRDFWIGEGGHVLGRLVTTYGPRMPQGGRHSFDPPYTAAESRKAYDHALEAVGPDLSPILVHVVINDEPAASWAESVLGGSRSTASAAGLGTLKLALNALSRHYGLVRGG